MKILILPASNVTSSRSDDRSCREDIKRPFCSTLRNRKIKSSASCSTLWSYFKLIELFPWNLRVVAAIIEKLRMIKVAKESNSLYNNGFQSLLKTISWLNYHFHKLRRKSLYVRIYKYVDSSLLDICRHAYMVYHGIELASFDTIFGLNLE